jgi:hypothetical protein
MRLYQTLPVATLEKIIWICGETARQTSLGLVLSACRSTQYGIGALIRYVFLCSSIIILNDRLVYFFSTAIVILIVIVITIKHYDQKNEIYWQTVFNFNHSPIAINSLITQSSFVYLDLLPCFKRMLKKYFPGSSTSTS